MLSTLEPPQQRTAPSPVPTHVIRINALGGLSVVDATGSPIAGAAAQPRRMAILAFLARAGQRRVTRDKLLALLWPDADDERGPRALTQALYALRKDLGDESAIDGAKELRLDPELISSDVSDFAAAVSRGDDAKAASLYHGPFLDGFHVPGADQFSRWVESERASLAAEYSRVLEALARASRAAGDSATSIGWWRKLAALEPLNARVTVGLMEALSASGDRAGALQHARVYELLVEQELDLPPDNEVIAMADRLRKAAEEPASVAVAAVAPNAPVVATVAAPAIEAAPPAVVEQPLTVAQPEAGTIPSAPPARTRRWARPAAFAAAGAAIVVGGLAIKQRFSTAPLPSNTTAVAIGQIATFGADSVQSNLTAPVMDLLTTSLARVPNIRVVSHGRMLELMRSVGTTSDTSAGGFVNAARLAGATEVIDGTLYLRPDGHLRLDLRRVDLATGAIGDVHTVEGSDLFALVDSGTAQIVAALGVAAPTGSVADVTTRSITAYRMYEQGIRAYYKGDISTSRTFFDAALAEDSLFALAAYYGALTEADGTKYNERIARAMRLAAHTSDRERLVILAGWANTQSSPILAPIADTLVMRYPDDVHGYLYTGMARVLDGDWLGGIDALQRAVAMDSLGLRGERPRCSACDALQWIVGAYIAADSLPAAEREARRWIRLLPGSQTAALGLANVLLTEGRTAEADSVIQFAGSKNLSFGQIMDLRAMSFVRAANYRAADSLMRAQTHDRDPDLQANALWDLTISLREQGRFREALDAARAARVAESRLSGSKSLPLNVLEAQVLLESDRPAVGAVLYDSLAHQFRLSDAPSLRARTAAWMMTQSLGARIAAGDTATAAKLVDSLRMLGEQSGFGRDRRLHHYVRGLLLAARGDDEGAVGELKASIFSPTTGFTRTNFELGRIYLRMKRPRDAVAILQPALRGAIDASNLYVTRTELHELLAQAWDAAGNLDSAAVHYAWIAKAWSAADPALAPRLNAARTRLAALKH